MEEETKICLEIAPDLQQLLADNEVDLVAAIRSQLRTRGIDVRRSNVTSIEVDGKAWPDGSRDPALIIAASGLTAAAVSWAVTQLINALGQNKSVVAKERRLRPVVDDQGRPVRTRDGQPIVYETEEVRLVESTKPQPTMTVLGSVGSFLKLELKSGREEQKA